jgi:hypothetical protein
MRPVLLLGLACLFDAGLAKAQTAPDLSVLASRAQSFAESLPNSVCTEILRQREVRYESRLRIRPNDPALVAPPPKVIEREIVSDLGYVLERVPTPQWREVRKVVRVGGKQITTKEKARERLLFGLKSERDRDRHRLLSEFQKYGLDFTVSDYSLSLLMFLPAEVRKFDYEFEKREFVGAEAMMVFLFRRRDTDVSVTVFNEKQLTHARLEGRLWIRERDGSPLRIQLLTRTKSEDDNVLDDGSVDYEPSRFGPLVATGVRLVRFVNNKPTAEAIYQYSNHQRFNAEAELKFDAEPEEPKRQENKP